MKKLVTLQNNTPITTSLIVAEQFGKNHRDVLRDIRAIIEQVRNERNFAPVEMFVESTYKDKKGESRPMYLMNHDGFALLAMGFNGEKALKFKLKFLKAFNKMREKLSKLSAAELVRLNIRAAGKVERRNVTDEIQRFNLRDFADGDKNPEARKRYGRLTAKTQINICGINAGGRDIATGRELALMLFTENAMANVLNRSYSSGNSFDVAESNAVTVALQAKRFCEGDIRLLN